jgi:methionine-rich copper-binding protein CopC
VVSVNFYVSYNTTKAENQPQEVDLEFSDDAVAIESGQPVFTKDTKIWLSNPLKEEIKLYLNEEEKETNSEKVELSEITNLSEGTYTLVVNTNTNEKVFGFTIQ